MRQNPQTARLRTTKAHLYNARKLALFIYIVLMNAYNNTDVGSIYRIAGMHYANVVLRY
ncbi:MAG: hypothetical protein NTU70_07700 [Methylococcales bacterium]|nr:hypothetical protein [Methylococcales bacterium]